MESVQKTPRGRLLERIEEPIDNTPIEDVVSIVPASEYVAPAPVVEHVEPARPVENIVPSPAAPNSFPNKSLLPATPRCSTAELQIGDFSFDRDEKTCEVIRIGTGLHIAVTKSCCETRASACKAGLWAWQ